MIKNNDIITFKVYNRQGETTFDRLSEAIEHLRQVSGYLSFTATSPDGESSISANLSKYTNSEDVEILNKHCWKMITKIMENRVQSIYK
jgi:hypothetical protein